VTALSQTDGQRKSRLGLGVFLCLLLCLFSVAAKAAPYYPHQTQTKVLTAAKMWSGENAAATSVPTVKVATDAMATFAFAVLGLQACRSTGHLARSGVIEPESVWFSSPLFDRPPPYL
jgi:hypothetical protein